MPTQGKCGEGQYKLSDYNLKVYISPPHIFSVLESMVMGIICRYGARGELGGYCPIIRSY